MFEKIVPLNEEVIKSQILDWNDVKHWDWCWNSAKPVAKHRYWRKKRNVAASKVHSEQEITK